VTGTRTVACMNRRTFIHATLGLTGGLGLAEADTSVGSLLKMLEDSPREHLPRELVRRIRAVVAEAKELFAT
jgi:hypothetical protein